MNHSPSSMSPEESPPLLRLAMWSGPRTVATALMRSFEARGDTKVVDEPLYAHYLKVTGVQHPGFAQVIESGDCDWRRVARHLTTCEVASGTRVHFQKHMSQHLLDGMQGTWLDSLTHAFLIREPRAMLHSLHRVWPNPTLADTGLPQQVAIFERVCERTGDTPPVLDSSDLLRDPTAILAATCERLGLPFTEQMLNWPKGPRATDGPWGSHRYATVRQSTGFHAEASRTVDLAPELEPLFESCQALYEKLYVHRLVA